MTILCKNTLRRRLGSISSMWWNGHLSMTGRQRTKSKSTEPRSEAVVLANEFKGFDTDTLKLSHYDYQIRFLGNLSFCRFQFSIGELNHSSLYNVRAASMRCSPDGLELHASFCSTRVVSRGCISARRRILSYRHS